jgi:kynurenine formamidase
MTPSQQPVTTQEIEQFFTTLSNWGRWGDDDRKGTLNLITPEVRLEAAKSMRHGTPVSLSRDLDPHNPDPVKSGISEVSRFSHVGEVEMTFGRKGRWDGVVEKIEIAPHGGNAHLDGLAHYSWDGLNYNGFPESESSADLGAAHLAVHDAADGIVTRGVLLDIAALFGPEGIERGYAITREDLEAAERRQGIRLRSGDALLIHSGNGADIVANGALYRTDARGPFDQVQTGLDPSCLPFLRERDVAVMGADGTHDVQPLMYEDFDYARPIHSVCLVAMGLWLMDNLDLTALAATCAELNQYDFLFTALPWRFVGSTSSPINPLAIF